MQEQLNKIWKTYYPQLINFVKRRVKDKSVAEDIYKTFGMSKKTFKMCIGNLYRKKNIEIKNDGIYLTDNP